VFDSGKPHRRQDRRRYSIALSRVGLGAVADVAELDFHHIPPGAKVLMPASIEKSVWTYFSDKAEGRGIQLSELLTEVLKRDIEINEALK
jgi:hypothetical protein